MRLGDDCGAQRAGKSPRVVCFGLSEEARTGKPSRYEEVVSTEVLVGRLMLRLGQLLTNPLFCEGWVERKKMQGPPNFFGSFSVATRPHIHEHPDDIGSAVLCPPDDNDVSLRTHHRHGMERLGRVLRRLASWYAL